MVNRDINFEIEDVKGINEVMFRVFSLDKDEDKVYTVVDKFGNILTPFFCEEIDIVPYLETNCLVLGREKTSKPKKLYSLYCSNEKPNDSRSKKVNFPFEVKHISYVNNKTLLFLTTQGLCFVDSNTFEPKSDYYDALYYCADPKVLSWIYEKEVQGENIRTVLTGPITTDGVIGNKAYDVLFRKERELVSSKVSRFQYDVIDATETIEDLKDREYDDNRKKAINVRKMIKKENH